ncbi:MAG: helix-turn-helix transcriptional regulator [Acidimicrobiales bacterium]
MAEAPSDIGAFIREQRQLAELSLRRLADKAGVSNPYLSQIERGLRKPSAEILQQLAKALEVSAETMYVQAGMLDAEKAHEHSGLESAIRRAQELTEEQRKALLGVYRSFVGANEAAEARVPTDRDQDRPAEGQ